MRRSFSRFPLWLALLVLALGLSLAAGGYAQKAPARDEGYERLKTFAEVLSLVQENYVEAVDQQKLIRGAIKGMLGTLDPHTSYLPPEVYREMQVQTEGKFGGLGIEITIRDDLITVVAPIEGTPADRAGIKAGDKIIKVDGASTKKMNLQEAVRRMRGPRGSKVTITILRKGVPKPFDVVIVRDIIRVRSVRSRMLESQVGYVRIRNFHKSTGRELEESLRRLSQKPLRGLVLDLRNNPGGLLQQAIEVADKFLPGGQLVVYTKGRLPNQNHRFVSRGRGSFLGFPMVVLVNAGSASASEIVAGALQDLARALILGEPTFGKGSVQTIVPLSDGSGLRLTTARYYTPKGRLIQEKGIQPDILVAAAPPPAGAARRRAIRERDLERHLRAPEGETPRPREPPPAGPRPPTGQRDVQLERAVELLKSWDVFRKTRLQRPEAS
ncbi:MAG: S41 family peptidase [Nitrospinota bacterium]